MASKKTIAVLRRVALAIALAPLLMKTLMVLGVAVFVIHEKLNPPDYDLAGPDVEHFAPLFKAISRSPDGSGTLDLAPLHGGRWFMACGFGGYTDPVQALKKLGRSIDPQDEARLVRAAEARMFMIEESEFALVSWEDRKPARVTFFANGFGPSGQEFQRCIRRPDTVLTISEDQPASNIQTFMKPRI